MATFVLVHGAWHGGWCWRDVRAILESNGHLVFTPTLTGLGERSHLLSPAIDLDTHILDVANVLEWEELSDVVLVGHSYGGNVITGVADRMKDRLRHVVYLDAHLPEDGDSAASHRLKRLHPDVTIEEIEVEIAQRCSSADSQSGLPPIYPNLFDIPEDRTDLYRWVERRITPHPVNSQVQPIGLQNGGAKGLPCTYILCAESSGRIAFMATADIIKDDPDWQYRELPTGHDAMVTMPDETAELLMEIV
jgi:pimeloyl-ACP methyl ester carboxylesterase